MNKKSLIKNIACMLYGLSIVLISAVFMISIHYTEQIQSRIQTVSILKDIRLQEWGQQPNPTNSIYTQNITLYQHNIKGDEAISTKSNFTQNFNYTYHYTNVSFAQGNSGRLNYIDHWMLKQDGAKQPINLKTINYGADKVYNYDYYAPPQRQLTILYNYIIDFLASDFLELFYTQYLYEYFFNDENLVINTVFLPLSFNINDAKNIYNHGTLGWNSVEKFRNWVALSLKGVNQAKESSFYERCVLEFKLTTSQMDKLVYQTSTIYNMMSALNGTIKSKLMDANKYKYKCQDKVCSSKQIAALQLGTGFLTKQPVFASLSLNKTIKQMNISLPIDIQYIKYAEQHKKAKQIPLQTVGALFSSGAFSDFQKMDILWKNQQKYSYIESLFNTGAGTGQSLVAYTKYLYENLVKVYGDAYSWGFTNYNHFQPALKVYQEFLLTQLYARAYQYKYITNQSKCEDYFVNDFEGLSTLCQNQQWNIVKNIRQYIKTYLYIQIKRTEFATVTNLKANSLITFFNDAQKSPFAANLAEINQIFAMAFNCENQICEPSELFLKQWGSNQIFKKLPAQYFPKPPTNILEWDTTNIFHNFIPDFYLQYGTSLNISQCKQLLTSGNTNGLLSLFNIIKLANLNKQPKKTSYITKTVFHIDFGGLILTSNSQQMIHGYKSGIIEAKQKMEVGKGGAPWLQNKVALLKLDNQVQIANNEKIQYPQYNMLNSGIYDQDQLRQILSIWGEKSSSSSYMLYQGEKYDDEGNLIQFSLFEKYTTDHQVKGTNMLGFHPMIDNSQKLIVYFQQGYHPIQWQYSEQVQYISGQNKISAYSYKIANTSQLNIKIEQLNHNSLKLMQNSELIVQPISGLTLQFSVNYQILSEPSFLGRYLGNNNINKLILYESNLSYQRTHTDQLQEISDIIAARFNLDLYGIIGGCVCVLVAVLLTVLYCRIPEETKKDTLLMASQQTI